MLNLNHRQLFVFASYLIICINSTLLAVDLVIDNKAVSAIKIKADAPDSVKAAALELQKYIKKSTGAELLVNPVNFDSFSNKIYLGQAGLDNNQSLKDIPQATDQINIHATKDALYIFGSDSGDEIKFPVKSHWATAPKIGTLLSVYAFLHKNMNINWYLPDILFEEVPASKNVSIKPCIETETPWFVQRCLWGQYTAQRADDWDWFFRNGTMPFIRGYHAGHSYSIWFPASKYFETDSDIFAVSPSGVRMTSQLCTSNPKTAKLLADKVIEFFKKNPDMPTCSIGPNDDSSILDYCQCKECLAKDRIDPQSQISYRIWEFNNEVARQVAKVYPDKLLNCYAYSKHLIPPKDLKLEHNLGVYITLWVGTGKWSDVKQVEKDKKLILDWIAAGANPANMQIYEYYGYNSGQIPRCYAWDIADELRFAKKNGIKLVMSEFHCTTSQSFDVYAVQRLLWDPDQSVDKLLAEFCQGMFGPGNTAMEKYYRALDRLQKEKKNLFKGEGIAELTSYLSDARKAIGHDKHYLDRLDVIEMPFNLVKLVSDIVLKHDVWQKEKGLNEASSTALLKAGKAWKDYYNLVCTHPVMAREIKGTVYRLPNEISFAIDVEGYLLRNSGSREITIKKTNIPPVIDGAGDDAVWKNAVLIDQFTEYSSKANQGYQTQARLAYDDNNIYGFIICQDLTKSYKRDMRKDDSNRDVWKENDVEVFLQPEMTDAELQRAPKQFFYQLLSNSLGAGSGSRFSCIVNDPAQTGSADGNFSATWKTNNTSDGWQIEFAIPFRSLGTGTPANRSKWKGNIGRHIAADNQEYFLSWYPLLGLPAIRPAAMGTMHFIDELSEENLLKSGDFEDKPELSWGIGKGNRDSIIKPSQERVRSGFTSMTIQTSAAKRDTNYFYSPKFAVESGSKYELSFWSYIEGDTRIIGGAAGLQSIACRIRWFDKDNKAGVIKWFFPQFKTVEKSWQQWTTDFTAPAGATSVIIDFMSYNIISKRWIDDVKVIKVK